MPDGSDEIPAFKSHGGVTKVDRLEKESLTVLHFGCSYRL